MRNTLAIWQREMKSYFVSPIAYVVLTVFLFLSGFFFYSILTAVIQSTMMQSQFGPGSQPVDVPGIRHRHPEGEPAPHLRPLLSPGKT